MKDFFQTSPQPKKSTQKNYCQNKFLTSTLLTTSVGLLSIFPAISAFAEGTAQWGLNQPMAQYGTITNLNPAQTRITSASRALYVDVLSAGEVINISACGNSDSASVGIEIYQTFPNTIDPAFIPTTGSRVLTQTLATGNVSCSNPMTGTLTTPLQFVTPSSGTYEIRLTTPSQYFQRVDITVTPNTSTPVNPSQAGGRLHAYAYGFNAGGFGLAQATNADFFVKVPGGRPGENFVWKLDLNQFAGFIYDIVGNSYGVNPPRSGFSVPQSGNNVTPEYPIYLSPPAQVGPRPTSPPGLTNLNFLDSQGIDNSISPGGTIGVQDSGTFTFTTDIIGNYSVQIDVNQDGIYSPVNAQGNDSGDVFINGMTNGPSTISVPWNGRTNVGAVLPNGTYNARVQMRAGEYHFVAGDAETSGGGANNGLTVFEALGTGIADTLVFWDDATFLTGTTTLPNGALSSTPQGKHTWGNFTGGGFGDVSFIDTYVYGSVITATTPVIVATTDVPPGISLSGRVWNDANGSANNTFANINNGTETGTNAGGLQSILVDSAGNVIASTPVAADGTYTFTGVTTNQTNVTLRLSPTAGTVGQPAPTAAVPTGWIGTSPLTTAAFNIGTTNIASQDFGIERLPDTTNVNSPSQNNPDGTTRVQSPNLAGSDPEDGALGSGATFRIVTLPTNGTLYYNNIAVTSGQQITNYNPTQLTIDPNGGTLTVSFTYAAIDAAGKEDPTPATVSMPFVNTTCDATANTALVLAGNASRIGDNEIRLTQNLGGQRGSAWSSQQISLANSFSLQFKVYLGTQDVGADGIAFAFHRDPAGSAATGAFGGALGVGGLDPAIAIEFDTYQNGGEIANDHTVIFDPFNQSLISSVVDLGNIEDGAWHLVEINWNPTTQNLTYQFDGITRANLTRDLINTDFGGNPNVFYGFTAATGGAVNDQRACVITAPPPAPIDYGDAPASYGTPNHTIVNGIRLGDLIDAESAAQPNPTASGDNITGTDDEDGITIPSSIGQGQTVTITAKVAGTNGQLQGWIDWNGDGDFDDTGEKIATNLRDNTPGDTNAAAGLIAFTTTVPANATTTQTYARFRWSTVTVAGPNGAANDGEVEDYTLTILASNPNVLLVKRITAINGLTTTQGGDDLAIYKNEASNVYDDNTIEVTNPNPPTSPADTNKWPTLNTFLIGGTNGGMTRPGDELEYTIYFLSTGDADAQNVLFCDRVPTNVTFLPTAFNGQTPAAGGLGSDRGILSLLNGTTAAFTNVADGDSARYFPPGSSPTSIYPNINCGGTNDNGAIVVNLGTVPKADSPGTPPNSYGFVRFRGRVK